MKGSGFDYELFPTIVDVLQGKSMSDQGNGSGQDSVGQCSVCGVFEGLFEIPEKRGRCCISCSADLTTVTLLTEEIDASTLSGRETESLVEELNAASARMLARSQSADFGSIPL